MNSHSIVHILRESCNLLEIGFDENKLNNLKVAPESYAKDEVQSFIEDLKQIGKDSQLMFLDNAQEIDSIESFIKEIELPIVIFKEESAEEIKPYLVFVEKDKIFLMDPEDGGTVENWGFDQAEGLLKDGGKVLFLAIFSSKSMLSTDPNEELDDKKSLTPVKRLSRLLAVEKKDVANILIYAVFIGIIGLTLPLGIQATMEWVAGGVLVTSIYILIALVIIGVLVSGGLQVLQITLVEYIQRRIFTKAALEFAIRTPSLSLESIQDKHAPELMNRFFDVLTLQKGLPKLLIDMTAGAIQIFFGLVLLSFYHPFFVFFGIALLGLLFLMFYLTGPKGLSTSITESKYKYKLVYWLEEVARSIFSFKISGTSHLPVSKTENNINKYLKYRKAHFRILVSQFSFIIIFKAIITGGVLIIGTILVVGKEITLGQFVASEVIIILIVSSVEKIILYMEVIYDMLTAVEKIAQVTDLPLDKNGGFHLPRKIHQTGYQLKIDGLNYTYPFGNHQILHDINLKINSGEKVCLSGAPDSGKTTLINTMTGLLRDFKGTITIQGMSVRDLNMTRVRDHIAKNVSREDIFDGTILENISLGKPGMNLDKIRSVIEMVGLEDKINRLPEGLNTHIISSGKGFSSSFIDRLILARCLAKDPGLLILNDYYDSFRKSEKLEMLQLLDRELKNCTVLSVSNDPLVMASSDRLIYMEKGSIVADTTFNEFMKDDRFKNLYDENTK